MNGRPGAALVLAAGLGTRMGALTRSTPKPLLAANGRSLLDRTIDRALEAGIDRIIVNVHAQADQVRAHLARRTDVDVAVSIEPALLETGGGARKALSLANGDSLLVVNSDAVWIGSRPLAPLLEAWRDWQAELDALLLLHPLRRCLARRSGGDFALDDRNRLRRAPGSPDAWVYSGAQIVRRASLASAGGGSWSFNRWWEPGLEAGRVRGVADETNEWIDVGTPEGLMTADARLKAHAAGNAML